MPINAGGDSAFLLRRNAAAIRQAIEGACCAERCRGAPRAFPAIGLSDPRRYLRRVQQDRCPVGHGSENRPSKKACHQPRHKETSTDGGAGRK